MNYVRIFPGFILAGIVLIFVGPEIGMPAVTSLGAATLGASISGLIAALNSRKLYKMATKEAVAQFHSDPERVKNMRGKFHLYSITEVQNQGLCWQHNLCDFSQFIHSSNLMGEVIRHSEDGERAVRYTASAGLRDKRLILLSKMNEGTEPTAVEIFPSFGDRFSSLHCGLRFIRTWSGRDLISPVLICEKHIAGAEREGILPPEVGTIVENQWSKEKKKIGSIALSAFEVNDEDHE